jgi:hypothetical protein
MDDNEWFRIAERNQQFGDRIGELIVGGAIVLLTLLFLSSRGEAAYTPRTTEHNTAGKLQQWRPPLVTQRRIILYPPAFQHNILPYWLISPKPLYLRK